MCDHKNTKCIKTTGQFYLYKCFEPDCGKEFKVNKNLKPKEPEKKTFIQKIFKK